MHNLSILLVDDSKVVRLVVAKQLEKIGFLTDIAEDGQAAVNAAKEKAYDLIFMDVMMPIVDGMEATKQIREFEKEQGRKSTIIVGVTGYTNRAECIAAGMDDFMFKPVTIEQLKGMIIQWHPEEALPGAGAPDHLFKDDEVSPESTEQTSSKQTATDQTGKRIEDLKSRLGFS